MRFRLVAAAALLLALAACGGTEPAARSQTEIPPGADTPREAVVGLFEALAADDAERAADLTVPGQALAVAAAEQAEPEELVAILDTGGRPVLVNFWRSFAAGVVDLSGTALGDVDVGDADEPFEIDGLRFATVEVRLPGQADAQSFIVREVDGWKVDVVATFAPGLAANIGRVPVALAEAPGGDRIIASVTEERSALEAALADPRLPPGVSQLVRSAAVALGGR